MTRYDLIVKKVNGCASPVRVEKHELGSFVKYVDVMKELSHLLNNHRLEVEDLQNKIDDLQAYKDLSIYLANRKGFDSVNDAINSIKPCECGCVVEKSKSNA